VSQVTGPLSRPFRPLLLINKTPFHFAACPPRARTEPPLYLLCTGMHSTNVCPRPDWGRPPDAPWGFPACQPLYPFYSSGSPTSYSILFFLPYVLSIDLILTWAPRDTPWPFATSRFLSSRFSFLRASLIDGPRADWLFPRLLIARRTYKFPPGFAGRSSFLSYVLEIPF